MKIKGVKYWEINRKKERKNNHIIIFILVSIYNINLTTKYNNNTLFKEKNFFLKKYKKKQK